MTLRAGENPSWNTITVSAGLYKSLEKKRQKSDEFNSSIFLLSGRLSDMDRIIMGELSKRGLSFIVHKSKNYITKVYDVSVRTLPPGYSLSLGHVLVAVGTLPILVSLGARSRWRQ